MFDDHEIVNDYAPTGLHTDLYDDAIQPFVHYQQSANPEGIDQSQRTYFQFRLGHVSFFVLDNRSFRSRQPSRPHLNSTAGWGQRTMLGELQMEHLRSWAGREGQDLTRLLVIVSGVPLTRNWSKGGDEFDSWAVCLLVFAHCGADCKGYLDEREEVLSLLWDRGGGMIISGDRHEHGESRSRMAPLITSHDAAYSAKRLSMAERKRSHRVFYLAALILSPAMEARVSGTPTHGCSYTFAMGRNESIRGF